MSRGGERGGSDAGLDSRLLSAPLCIVETTYLGLNGDKDSAAVAQEHAHVLLEDLVRKVATVEDVDQQLVLCHFSARYSSSQIIAECSKAKLFSKPVALALRAFGKQGRGDDVCWV